nr:hypothetical protein [Rickettsia montanensis]
MFYSPKPELIFDANHMAVGVKDRENKLVIHADKTPALNRTYWANWFGQVRKPKFILISIINLNAVGA